MSSLFAAGAPPPKPWERAGTSSSGPAPFKPPSAGSTSDIVEASGTAKPGEIVSTSNTAVNRTALSRPVPTRPWEQNYGNGTTNNYGGTLSFEAIQLKDFFPLFYFIKIVLFINL